ncbi:uncharacterized protein LOC126666705 isoform X2 [Mercurialis annua]|uniref:uncharacterized protein LOC126666705 isoform X2 n=1 Tax=Mercurialis annua TaxID=3986 RepID=UPI00215E3724|nr:uncharacterized protein LOC126666705 isoform X2 [Mercurialis annua]
MASIKIGLSNQAIFAITLLILWICLLLCTSFAASGGRMGGDAFSSSDQSSSSSSHSDSHHHYYHHDTNKAYSSYSSKDERSNGGSEDGGSSILTAVVLIVFAFVAFFMFYFGAKNKESSLIMVQVGLTGKANSLQKQLNEIAKTADTSSSKGWNLILSALLQHRQHFISGYATVKYHAGIPSLENNFRQLLKEERQKIDIESLVNVNNIRRQKAVICKADKLDKEYIVVTIFIAAKNTYEASTIKSIDDLKRVLQSLEFSSEELLAVEVLWTPQDENDTLSEDELLEDYPLLRPI